MLDEFLLVVDEYLENIYQIDAAKSETLQLLPLFTANHPLAVAYDRKEQVVFWTEYTRYPSTVSIHAYNTITKKLNIVYNDTDNDNGKDTTVS